MATPAASSAAVAGSDTEDASNRPVAEQRVEDARGDIRSQASIGTVPGMGEGEGEGRREGEHEDRQAS